MKPIFIIEHLEPSLWPWCLIEYKNISKIAGREHVWFTNSEDSRSLKPYGHVFSESIRDMPLGKACILDPDAEETLTPELAEDYDHFIFGGILGEEEFNWRTREELTQFMKGIPTFNLGAGQFSTDNAVFVTKKIIEGANLEDLSFQDTIEIEINDGESILLPYRYPLINGKPQISPELITYLKKKKDF